MVDPAGQNQIAVAPGANHRVTVEMVAARKEDFAWPEVMLCPWNCLPRTVAWALREAKSRGALTVFNPAPVQPLPDEVWSHVDYLTPNEGEAARLTGGCPTQRRRRLPRWREAWAPSRSRSAPRVFSRAGADAPPRGGARRLPPSIRPGPATASTAPWPSLSARAVDLTDALRFASAAGALACTRRGAQDALPRADVESLLASCRAPECRGAPAAGRDEREAERPR